MPMPSSIAVFCGSKSGNAPAHLESAKALGAGMAEHGIDLVYGGGRVGLMGAVADAVQAGGGNVTGIIPEFLMQREVGNERVDKLEVTTSMHTRKQRMFELSDAFVSLAGGLGTLDETIELITWKQLGLHNKPIIALSVDGYWDILKTAVQGFNAGGFAYADDAELFRVVDSVEEVFYALAETRYNGSANNSERL